MGKQLATALADSLPLLDADDCSSLNLSENRIDGVTATNLFSQLLTNCVWIHSLNISKNTIGYKGVQSLNKLLQFSQTLTHLDVSRNQLSDATVASLCSVIERHRSIETLILSDNAFGNIGANALGDMIEYNFSITKLDLSWNNIKGSGAQAIARGLMENLKIRDLNLSFTGFGASRQSIVKLAECLANNQTLTHLNFESNRCIGEHCKIIAEGLQKNTTLLGFHFGGNDERASLDTNMQLNYQDAPAPGAVDPIALAQPSTTNVEKEVMPAKPAKKGKKQKKGKKGKGGKGVTPRVPEKIYATPVEKPLPLSCECWICGGWVSHVFTLAKEHNIWIREGETPMLKIDLDGWRPCKFEFSDGVWKLGRILPPKRCCFIIMVGTRIILQKNVEQVRMRKGPSMTANVIDFGKEGKEAMHTASREFRPRKDMWGDIIKQPKLQLHFDRHYRDMLLADLEYTAGNDLILEACGGDKAMLKDTQEFLAAKYEKICAVFRVTATRGGGNGHTIEWEEFLELCQDCGLTDGFLTLQALKNIFDLVNKNAHDEKSTEMERFEFLEALIRIAIAKYVTPESGITILEGMRRVVDGHLSSALDKQCILTQLEAANEFLASPDSFDALEQYIPNLKRIFTYFASIIQGTGSRMSMHQYVNLLQNAGFFDSKKQFTQRHGRLCFSHSVPSVVDEMKSKRHIHMDFRDFLESVVHIASMKKLKGNRFSAEEDSRPMGVKVETCAVMLIDGIGVLENNKQEFAISTIADAVMAKKKRRVQTMISVPTKSDYGKERGIIDGVPSSIRRGTFWGSSPKISANMFRKIKKLAKKSKTKKRKTTKKKMEKSIKAKEERKGMEGLATTV